MKNFKGIKLPKIQLLDDDDNVIPHGNITYIIAFIIPFFLFIALYYIREIYPFGDNAYLRSDMYHQYAPFFSEFWNKLKNGEDLTYSWDIGMGTNFTALYAYYLASPMNWFIVLFPQKYMIEIMNAIIIIKMSLASVTFTYYISKHFKNKSCIIAIFGMFYGMSGYVAAYSWNIMWLDCILLLPLIFLGLERLVNENKSLLYCITLGLCIFTNYYISIMVCISVVVYFVVLMISYKGKCHFTIYLKKFLRFGLYSILAGGLAACLLLPEVYAFSLSASSNMTFPKTLNSYFTITEMLVRQLINVPVHLELEHYPNIYCGVGIFILIPLYIMNKNISTREKAGKILILLMFLTSFNLNIPNFIWHGFHFPNSLPARQAFIYIFFVLAMSYEAFSSIKNVSDKVVTGSIASGFIFLVLAEQLHAGDTYDFKIMYISGAFIIAYSLLIYLYKRNRLKAHILLFLAFAITIIECTINMESTGLSTTGRTYYLRDNNAISTLVEQIEETDDSFYRMEKVTGIRSKNDSAWHNYPSISTFSSTSNAGISELFGLLGCQHSTNAYAFKGATALTASMFSVKYLISNQFLTESPILSYDRGTDGEFIYKYNYTLPVGFMVNSELEALWDTSSIRNGFEVQNSFIEASTGIEDVLELTYNYHTEPDVNIEPVRNDHMYLLVRNKSIDTIGVSINGTVTNYSDLKSNNYIIDIGYVKTTDDIEVYADSTMNLCVYTLNSSKFIAAYEQLNEGGLNVTKHSDTKIEGTVNAVNDGVMYFSIPYDAGWTIKVDGKKVSSFPIKDALIGINVPAGNHEITLSYTPVGLIKGLIITFLCIIILIALTIFRRKLINRKISIAGMPLFLQELIITEDKIFNRPTKVIKTVSEINEEQKDNGGN